MFVVARGIKAWIVGLVGLAIVILFLIGLFYLGLLLLPVFIALFVLSYFFKVLNKFKKEKPQEYIDIKYRTKK